MLICLVLYGTTQMQVDGFARVLALLLEYSKTITCVKNMSAQHKHNTTVRVMSLNRQDENFKR